MKFDSQFVFSSFQICVYMFTSHIRSETVFFPLIYFYWTKLNRMQSMTEGRYIISIGPFSIAIYWTYMNVHLSTHIHLMYELTRSNMFWTKSTRPSQRIRRIFIIRLTTINTVHHIQYVHLGNTYLFNMFPNRCGNLWLGNSNSLQQKLFLFYLNVVGFSRLSRTINWLHHLFLSMFKLLFLSC